MDRQDKADEYEKILTELRHTKPTSGFNSKPVSVKKVKVGRNEPCPCGSGKKYKKRCGA